MAELALSGATISNIKARQVDGIAAMTRIKTASCNTQ